jgi:hypothetical protein
MSDSDADSLDDDLHEIVEGLFIGRPTQLPAQVSTTDPNRMMVQGIPVCRIGSPMHQLILKAEMPLPQQPAPVLPEAPSHTDGMPADAVHFHHNPDGSIAGFQAACPPLQVFERLYGVTLPNFDALDESEPPCSATPLLFGPPTQAVGFFSTYNLPCNEFAEAAMIAYYSRIFATGYDPFDHAMESTGIQMQLHHMQCARNMVRRSMLLAYWDLQDLPHDYPHLNAHFPIRDPADDGLMVMREGDDDLVFP